MCHLHTCIHVDPTCLMVVLMESYPQMIFFWRSMVVIQEPSRALAMVRVIASIPKSTWLSVCLDLLTIYQKVNPAVSSLAHGELLEFVQSQLFVYPVSCHCYMVACPDSQASPFGQGIPYFSGRMLGAVPGKMPQVAFVSTICLGQPPPNPCNPSRMANPGGPLRRRYTKSMI